jgi:hypothetical protein
MLTTETVENVLDLLELGSTYHSIEKETGITRDDASAVAKAYDKGEAAQLFRELQLAAVLESAASKLRSGKGWDEITTREALHEIWEVYPKHVKKALGLALLSGNSSWLG